MLAFQVTPLPTDDIGPCWLSVEVPVGGIEYALYSIFVPYEGARPQDIPVTSINKRLYAYWRGDRIYNWTVVV